MIKEQDNNNDRQIYHNNRQIFRYLEVLQENDAASPRTRQYEKWKQNLVAKKVTASITPHPTGHACPKCTSRLDLRSMLESSLPIQGNIWVYLKVLNHAQNIPRGYPNDAQIRRATRPQARKFLGTRPLYQSSQFRWRRRRFIVFWWEVLGCRSRLSKPCNVFLKLFKNKY